MQYETHVTYQEPITQRDEKNNTNPTHPQVSQL